MDQMANQYILQMGNQYLVLMVNQCLALMDSHCMVILQVSLSIVVNLDQILNLMDQWDNNQYMDLMVNHYMVYHLDNKLIVHILELQIKHPKIN
jgi:hypothetical protein